MNKVASLFDDILKIVGASYLFLTIVGFIDLKIYYAKFGVSINEYISVSEVLFSALDKILLILMVLVIQLAIWLYLFRYLFEYDLEESVRDGEIRPKMYHDETIHRFFKSKPLRAYWITILTGTILSLVFSLIYSKVKFLSLLRDFFFLNYWMAMCLYMMWIQATRSMWEAMRRKKENNAKMIITIIVFLSVLLMSVWVKNTFLFNRVRKYGINSETEVFLNDNSKIFATDTIRYVGRTEGYLFYWNRFTHQTTILPASEIKKIIIKE